jgi:Icc-related predicted phosphoesterase
LIVAGTGGARRYASHAENQYSEVQMTIRVYYLTLLLLASNIHKIDIFVTHSPPKGIHDLEDPPHQGFTSFLWFMRKFKPAIMLHGHTFNFKPDDAEYSSVKILNINPYKLITYTIDTK